MPSARPLAVGDVERAGQAPVDPHKRDLQLEARAHIAVQQWIDEGGLDGRSVTSDGLLELHKRFCELLPDDMLWVEDAETHQQNRIAPGRVREHDVRVGRHVPISPGVVPRFLVRFERALQDLGKADSVIAAATAHHRLLWIHPFLDGNGGVTRLISYAMLRENDPVYWHEEPDGPGFWAITRHEDIRSISKNPTRLPHRRDAT